MPKPSNLDVNSSKVPFVLSRNALAIVSNEPFASEIAFVILAKSSSEALIIAKNALAACEPAIVFA